MRDDEPKLARASERPIFLYAGRVAIEKSLEDYLRLDLPGTKWVVGDGPARASLEAHFPQAIFYGMKYGRELAYFYQQADAFVFPSRTDTFGLVNLEAMACGLPVAAYPVTGPIDVIEDGVTGFVVEDETSAVGAVRHLSRLSRTMIRERFEERFTARRMARDYLTVYRDLLGAAAPRPRIVSGARS